MTTTPGAVEQIRKIHNIEGVALGYRRLSDYWMVRALIAEGHDIEPIPHPSRRTS